MRSPFCHKTDRQEALKYERLRPTVITSRTVVLERGGSLLMRGGARCGIRFHGILADIDGLRQRGGLRHLSDVRLADSVGGWQWTVWRRDEADRCALQESRAGTRSCWGDAFAVPGRSRHRRHRLS